MPPVQRVALLTSHLQPFMLAGIDALLRRGQVQVLLMHWPAPAAAPLVPVPAAGLAVHEKTPHNREKLQRILEDFRPGLVYGPGWMDRDYLRWIRQCRRRGAVTVMGMDNQWKDTLKQHLLCLASRWLLRSRYTHIFIPGSRQLEYARRLGFREDRILKGLYTPDTSLFSSFYTGALPQKQAAYSRQLLYLGRLVAHKADGLLTAFRSLSHEERRGWTLLAVGNGPLSGTPVMDDPGIRHTGYVAQEALGTIIAQSGIGCLVSRDEPWGTVIQELAAAGLPLIVSSQCGASDEFVLRNFNGTICDGYSVAAIREALIFMFAQPDDRLLAMSGNSHRLGLKRTPDDWADTLLTLIARP